MAESWMIVMKKQKQGKSSGLLWREMFIFDQGHTCTCLLRKGKIKPCLFIQEHGLAVGLALFMAELHNATGLVQPKSFCEPIPANV